MIRQSLLFFHPCPSILPFLQHPNFSFLPSKFTHLFWHHVIFFLNSLSTFTCASFHPVFWFATSHSIILSSSFILTPNGLNLINRALYSLSHTLYTHTLTHKHSVLRSLLCRLNAESVIPWIKYKERWGSIRWLGTFKVIPRHCVF